MKLLKQLRTIRGFNAVEHTSQKVNEINKFFRTEQLDAAVIGLSGGIDSAVTLSLLIEASKQKDSPIKKILGLSMPIFCKGTSDQSDAQLKAELLAKKYSGLFEFKIVDLQNAHNSYVYEYGQQDSWCQGQLASMVRTPMLYYAAADLQHRGYKSIVVGTTNRDEMAYIGFYGKASDAMVDLQPIADLHKSEVYQIAEYLEVPKEIITTIPKGDVFDSRNDEQMIGANYDQIELFTLMVDYSATVMHNFNNTIPDIVHSDWYKNIKKLHEVNAHKYKVGYPSRFVDILPRKFGAM